MIEKIMFYYFSPKFSDDSAKICRITRQLISRFDLSDLKQMIDKSKEQLPKSVTLYTATEEMKITRMRKNIIARLKERGVSIPNSKTKMKNYKF